MDKPDFYVIVHYNGISPPNDTSTPEDISVWGELQRIINHEEYLIVSGSPFIIPEGIPKDRHIQVCGALLEVCVKSLFRTLNSAGHDASIYLQATRKK